MVPTSLDASVAMVAISVVYLDARRARLDLARQGNTYPVQILTPHYMCNKLLPQASAVAADVLLVNVKRSSSARVDPHFDESAAARASGGVIPVEPAKYLDCRSIRRPADNGIASRSTAKVESVPKIHLASLHPVPIDVEQVGVSNSRRVAANAGSATLRALKIDVIAEGVGRGGLRCS